MLGLLPLCCEISPSSNEVNILDLSVRVLQWNELVGRGGTRRDRDRSASLDKDAFLVGAGPLASPLLGGENGAAEEEPDSDPRPGRAHSSSGAGCSVSEIGRASCRERV